jgi:hypothetical protein
MARRFKAQPPIKLNFWKRDGKLWFAEPADLEAVIKQSGLSDKEIQKRMGAGYKYIQEVLDGKRIDGWAVSHIEWGINSDLLSTTPMHSWPPRN